MFKKLCLCALVGAVLGAGCSNSRQSTAAKMSGDEVIQVANDDAAMNAALAQGNATLPQFRAALGHPKPSQSQFALYARFTENGRNEYLWLKAVKISGAAFQGRISNVPGMLTGVKLGQTVTVPAKDVGDWMFIENGKMVGGYTSRVLDGKK